MVVLEGKKFNSVDYYSCLKEKGKYVFILFFIFLMIKFIEKIGRIHCPRYSFLFLMISNCLRKEEKVLS